MYCVPCDTLKNLMCTDCSELSSTEVKGITLQKRTLKFQCWKCQNHELDVLQNSLNGEHKIIEEKEEKIRLLEETIQQYEIKKILDKNLMRKLQKKKIYSNIPK